MRKYMWGKMSACMLILALVLGMTEPAVRVWATEIEEGADETGGNEEDGTEITDPDITEDEDEIDNPDAEDETDNPDGEDDSDDTENPDPTVTDTPEVTPEEIVTITPFAGQWKYFGQERTLYPDVHFSLSNGDTKLEGVSVVLESEEVGMQHFKIEDERTDEEKQEVGYKLATDAALYEIKPYTVPTGVCAEDEMINIKARSGKSG